MKRSSHVVVLFGVIIVALAACERSPAGSPAGSAAEIGTPDSVKILNTQLAQAKAVSAQQDSLIRGVRDATQLLDQIDKELSRVKGLKGNVRRVSNRGEGPTDPRVQARDALLGKVREVTRLLAASRAHVKALSESKDSLTSRAAEYATTIASLEEMVMRQKSELAQLSLQLDSLKTTNAVVTAQRDAVTDTAKTLRREVNTVYYVVGTKDDLIKRGVITEEGAKRFLLFGGRTVIPSRKLDSTVFTSIDKFADVDIPVANEAKTVRIISRHDHTLVEIPKASNGKLEGKMHITNPAQFWAASKYLIVIEG
ncbi:MAG: hypothetical protein ABJD07_00925 [Gemmatimonadaceae bacterium]